VHNIYNYVIVCTMKEHHMTKYWRTISPKERSERARKAALARWEKVSKEERHAIAMSLVNARNK